MLNTSRSKKRRERRRKRSALLKSQEMQSVGKHTIFESPEDKTPDKQSTHQEPQGACAISKLQGNREDEVQYAKHTIFESPEGKQPTPQELEGKRELGSSHERAKRLQKRRDRDERRKVRRDRDEGRRDLPLTIKFLPYSPPSYEGGIYSPDEYKHMGESESTSDDESGILSLKEPPQGSLVTGRC